MIGEDPKGKRLFRPKLRWEDSVKKEVIKLEPDTKRRKALEDRNRWQSLCLACLVLKVVTKKEEEEEEQYMLKKRLLNTSSAIITFKKYFFGLCVCIIIGAFKIKITIAI